MNVMNQFVGDGTVTPVRMSKGPPPKSAARDTAERSHIAAFGLVVCMGATHFIPATSHKQVAPRSAFQQRTEEALGYPLQPIPPQCMINQDETTIACTIGSKSEGSASTYVQLTNGDRDNGKLSDYSDPNFHKVRK